MGFASLDGLGLQGGEREEAEMEGERGRRGGDLHNSSAMSSSKKGLRCIWVRKGLEVEMGVEEGEDVAEKGEE